MLRLKRSSEVVMAKWGSSVPWWVKATTVSVSFVDFWPTATPGPVPSTATRTAACTGSRANGDAPLIALAPLG